MEFWKLAAIITWTILAVGIIAFLYLRRNWLRLGKDVVLGQQLHTSIDRLFEEVAQAKVKKDTLANVSKHVLWRLTRIGTFAVIAAMIPTVLIVVQVVLLNNQNRLLDNQTSLLEADRRSSLVLLMDNILTDVSKEIDQQKQDINKDSIEILDSIGYSLSSPLIGKIAALSQGLLPYKFLVDGKLTKKEYSIERGQLLLALVNSNLDRLTLMSIYNSAIFQNSYLRNGSLTGAYLSGADLRGAELRRTDLSRAQLHKAYLSGAYLSEADLGLVKNLTFAQLIKTRLLHKCENLDPELKERIQAAKPCLFTSEGCPLEN